MSDAQSPFQYLTAEDYAARRYDLPEGGRWTELVAGEVVDRDPPDDLHGTVITNLSRAAAQWVQESPPEAGGFFFEGGVVTTRDPDTVRTPPMLLTTTGSRFPDFDFTLHAPAPPLVLDVLTGRESEAVLLARTQEFHTAGVERVWWVDPRGRRVLQFDRDARSVLAADDRLDGTPLMTGFSVRVAELFKEPEWWAAPAPRE